MATHAPSRAPSRRPWDTPCGPRWSTSRLAKTPGTFPSLRRLDRGTYLRPAEADLLHTPLVSRLEQYQVRFSISDHNLEAAAALFKVLRESKVPDITFRWVRLRAQDWSSGYCFVRTPSGRFSVHVFTTKMNTAHEEVVQADVLTALEHLAPLKPESLTVAHRFASRVKDAFERRAQELGATLTE
ncbi:hypothetical protein [Myxococcus stipitatus]|uniref:hypothetical protein n=1 Tax=Myxococcus stipitatus TaxID=83455 RepID=UPI0030CBDB89